MNFETTFLLGAVGAAAPEILRLYELRSKPEQFRWSWAYLSFTAPFLFLGGLVAVILPATTVWGAFYTGLSLPVIITSAAKKAQDSPPGKQVAASGQIVPMSGFRAYINALF
jgi:hypothetical protein